MGIFGQHENDKGRSSRLRDGNWRNQYDLYVVQKGDSLVSIAEEMYGDSASWKRIQEANPIVLGDPQRINPGLVLRIPKGPN